MLNKLAELLLLTRVDKSGLIKRSGAIVYYKIIVATFTENI